MIATKLLNDLGYTSESIRGGGLSSLNSQIKDEKELAENLGIGEMTLHDIIEELEKLPYIHFKAHDYKDKVFHVTISNY